MTSTKRFSTQEWSVIAGAPLLAAMSGSAGGRGGMRSTLAAVRGYRDARDSYDTELMRELLDTPSADAIERPRDREALRAEAAAALRQAKEILDRVASAERQSSFPRARVWRRLRRSSAVCESPYRSPASDGPRRMGGTGATGFEPATSGVTGLRRPHPEAPS
jgi:hypothetical protein